MSEHIEVGLSVGFGLVIGKMDHWSQGARVAKEVQNYVTVGLHVPTLRIQL